MVQLAKWISNAESDDPDVSDLPPDNDPFGVVLDEGDRYINPSGWPHAPMSLADTLMVGTSHLCSMDLCRSMELSILELEHRWLTNEEPAEDYYDVMSYAATLWKSGAAPYEWGTKSELRSFQGLLEVSGPTSLASWKL